MRMIAMSAALAAVMALGACTPNIKTRTDFIDGGRRDYVVQSAFLPGKDVVAVRVIGTSERSAASVRKSRRRFERVAATALATECRRRGLTASARGARGNELRRFVSRGRASYWLFGRYCV